MKAFYVIALAISITTFSSCRNDVDDDEPKLRKAVWKTTYNKTDTVVPLQDKGILVEDFTGVNCTNCPKSARKTESLSNNKLERVVRVAIHARPYNFTYPIDKADVVSDRDFRNQDAESVYDWLEVNAQLPAIAVDRSRFDFDEDVQLHFLDLEKAVDERLKESASCNMSIETISKTNTQLTFKLTTYYHEDLSSPQYQTVYLLENNMHDVQLDGRAYEKDYEHNNVLRKRLTPTNTGDLLSNSPKKGDVFITVYTLDINQGVDNEKFDSSWNSDNLSVAAFVHGKDGVDVSHAVDSEL